MQGARGTARSMCSGQGACEVCMRTDIGGGGTQSSTALVHLGLCLTISLPSESGVLIEQCSYGTGAGVGAVELCSM